MSGEDKVDGAAVRKRFEIKVEYPKHRDVSARILYSTEDDVEIGHEEMFFFLSFLTKTFHHHTSKITSQFDFLQWFIDSLICFQKKTHVKDIKLALPSSV